MKKYRNLLIHVYYVKIIQWPSIKKVCSFSRVFDSTSLFAFFYDVTHAQMYQYLLWHRPLPSPTRSVRTYSMDGPLQSKLQCTHKYGTCQTINNLMFYEVLFAEITYRHEIEWCEVNKHMYINRHCLLLLLHMKVSGVKKINTCTLTDIAFFYYCLSSLQTWQARPHGLLTQSFFQQTGILIHQQLTNFQTSNQQTSIEMNLDIFEKPYAYLRDRMQIVLKFQSSTPTYAFNTLI